MATQLVGLAVLIVLSALVAFVIVRIPGELLPSAFGGNVATVAGGLFVLLLVVQLIQPQSWTPDLLKVVAGVVAGAVAAKRADAKQDEELKNQQVAIGEQIYQAARDINNVHSELSKIEDSIVNQQISSKSKNMPVLLYSQTDSILFDYRDNVELREAYEAMKRSSQQDLQFKPIQADQERIWYDRKIELFRKIPGAERLLKDRVNELRAHAWHVVEVRFDFSSVRLDLILQIEKRLPLES